MGNAPRRERCQSGRMGRSRKPLRGFPSEGSNPSLSEESADENPRFLIDKEPPSGYL